MVGIKLYSNMTGNKAGKWPRIKLYSNTARNIKLETVPIII
jgi:hypothetical protein